MVSASHERDDRDGEEDQHRHRRPDTEVQPLDQVVVGHHRHRARFRRAAGEHEDVVEDPEGVEGTEQHGDQNGRLDQRQRDHPEPLHGGGPVERGGFQQVFGHQCQTGHQQQRHERHRLPHFGEDDDPGRLPRVGQRRPVRSGQVAQPLGPGEPPRERGHHGDDRVRHQGGGAHQAATDDGAVHDDRQRHSEDELEDDSEEGVEAGDAEGPPPDR
jgi:hypothetical protein